MTIFTNEVSSKMLKNGIWVIENGKMENGNFSERSERYEFGVRVFTNEVSKCRVVEW